MLLNDITYLTDEIEADALRKASWARQYEAAIAARKRRGTRSMVGHALINLGRLIAAEPIPTRAPVRVGR